MIPEEIQGEALKGLSEGNSLWMWICLALILGFFAERIIKAVIIYRKEKNSTDMLHGISDAVKVAEKDSDGAEYKSRASFMLNQERCVVHLHEVKEMQGRQLAVLKEITSDLRVVTENQKDLAGMMARSATEHAVEAKSLRDIWDVVKLLGKAS